MGLVRSAASLMMVGLLVAAIPGGSLAQEPAEPADEDTGAVITEFVGVPWGAGETTVRDQHGEPWAEDTMDTSHPQGGWKILLYDKEIDDMQATLLYALQGDSGLVEGFVWLRGFKTSQCETAYEGVVSIVQDRHPGIEGETSSHKGITYLDFCQALRIDEASRSTRWTDPANGVTLELSLNDHTSMALHYSTPEARRSREK